MKNFVIYNFFLFSLQLLSRFTCFVILKKIVTFKGIIIFSDMSGWIRCQQTQTRETPYRAYQCALFVSCRLWQLAKLCSRRGGENFSLAQRINPAKTRKKNTHARQMQSYINFHHSHSVACCSKSFNFRIVLFIKERDIYMYPVALIFVRPQSRERKRKMIKY